jgi:hypothetical protein
VASKKTRSARSSETSLINEVEQTAESVLRHVGELVGQLSRHVTDAAQSVAETTSSVRDRVFSPESGPRQHVIKLIGEVESAGQELSDRAGDLFDSLMKKVVAAEHRPAQKRTKKKKKPAQRTVKKKVAKKKKKVAKKVAKKAGKKASKAKAGKKKTKAARPTKKKVSKKKVGKKGRKRG